MIKTNSSWTLAVAAAVGVCALAGCNQRESANETAKDVAEERQDARENVAEEQREAGQTAMEGAEDRAAAEYDVAVAQADGQRKIAKEKCETLASDAQEACKEARLYSWDHSMDALFNRVYPDAFARSAQRGGVPAAALAGSLAKA